MILRFLFRPLLTVLALTTVPAPGREHAPIAAWFDLDKDNAWLHAYDPTLISRRLVTELSYQDLDSSQSLLKLETTLRWGWAVREDLAFGVQMMVPVAVKLSDKWSAALTYKPRWNLLTDEVRHRVALDTTRVWGSDHQFALSFGTEIPLSSDSLGWKILTGFTWYF